MQVASETKVDIEESTASCESCRRRKKRCGRELPTCKGCCKRGEECIYPSVTHKRKSDPPVFTSSQIKFNIQNKNKQIELQNNIIKTVNVYSNNSYNKDIKILVYQPISPPSTSPESDLSITVLSPIPSTQSHKFETHLILMLTSQIIQHDQHIISEIDWFVNKMHLGIFGGLTKAKFHLNQEWIQELLQPDFKSKLIDQFFTYYHPLIPNISKYRFFTNMDRPHPVLISVLMYVGYLSYPKQHPELRKYLKHCAMIQLKKNMFNINLSVCQALYIISYSMLLQGFGKQTLTYFNQACLMASALGMHRDMPGLNPIEQDQRHCIRVSSISIDCHLAHTITAQPYYLFMEPRVTVLNPEYQINPYSTDPHERLRADCVSVMRDCYHRYFLRATTHMIVYSLMISNKKDHCQTEDFQVKVQFFNELLNYCMVQTLLEYLKLSSRYHEEEETMIINREIWVFTTMYYQLCLVLYSQFPATVDPETGYLNSGTVKAIQAATAIYKITSSHPDSCIYMCYHYLSGISLFYIKLIISFNSHPHIQSKLIEKFQQIYELFILSKQKYKLSDDILEVVESMAKHFKIKLS